MGDRLATTDTGRKWGSCRASPFWWGLGLHLTQYRLGRGLPPYQVDLDPSSRLATTDMGRKLEGLYPFWGKLGPYLTQCGLDRCLPPYQVDLDPSSRLATIHGPKSRGVLCPIFDPHLTQCHLGRGLPHYQVAS